MKSYSSSLFAKSALYVNDLRSPFTVPLRVTLDDPSPVYLPKTIMLDPLNRSGKVRG